MLSRKNNNGRVGVLFLQYTATTSWRKKNISVSFSFLIASDCFLVSHMSLMAEREVAMVMGNKKHNVVNSMKSRESDAISVSGNYILRFSHRDLRSSYVSPFLHHFHWNYKVVLTVCNRKQRIKQLLIAHLSKKNITLVFGYVFFEILSVICPAFVSDLLYHSTQCSLIGHMATVYFDDNLHKKRSVLPTHLWWLLYNVKNVFFFLSCPQMKETECRRRHLQNG